MRQGLQACDMPCFWQFSLRSLSFAFSRRTPFQRTEGKECLMYIYITFVLKNQLFFLSKRREPHCHISAQGNAARINNNCQNASFRIYFV